MSKHTTIRLPDDLLRQVKRKASAEGRTFTALVEEGLRMVLAQRAHAPKGPPIPISKATGGFADLLPGLDPTKLATQIQELEDSEYIERLKSGFE
jgi:hypothetical protein